MQSRSLHPTDAEHKGFGHSPTSILQRKWCLYRQTHCLQMQTLYIRLPCLRMLWNLSTCFPKFENHFAIRAVCFQVQLEVDGYFSAQKFSHLQPPPQAGRVGTTSQVLNLIFYKSSFKTLVGLRPNPIFSTKVRWLCILSSKGLMTHKVAGIIQPSLFLPKFSSSFLATRRKWRIFKSFCWHSSIFVVVYSNNLI